MDVILVKTSGEREFVNKTGQVVQQFANVYLHYMTSCLTKYDQSFTFQKVKMIYCQGLKEAFNFKSSFKFYEIT